MFHLFQKDFFRFYFHNSTVHYSSVFLVDKNLIQLPQPPLSQINSNNRRSAVHIVPYIEFAFLIASGLPVQCTTDVRLRLHIITTINLKNYFVVGY
jgi:hypothetical protein